MNIKYLVISDIHLGHSRTTTEFIIDNLRFFFLKNLNIISSLDMIFLAGDVFDKLLASYSKEYVLAYGWLMELYNTCLRYNIKLRILEGTPSHDWKQIKLFEKIINSFEQKIDFKYIDNLYIENIDNINILYVPDEYKPNATDTFLDVKKLLNKHKLEQVDIAIMHGQFNYQLPVKLESNHNELDYLNIVKYYIHIGHIHTFSTYSKRIIANGSFDRLCHNEEEPKGCVYVNINTNNEIPYSYKFLENKRAKIYKTIDLTNIKSIVKELKNRLKNIPSNSYIRVLLNSNDNISNSLLDYYREKDIYIKVKKQEKEQHVFLKQQHVEIFTITSNNVIKLIKEDLLSKNVNDDDIKECIKILKDTQKGL